MADFLLERELPNLKVAVDSNTLLETDNDDCMDLDENTKTERGADITEPPQIVVPARIADRARKSSDVSNFSFLVLFRFVTTNPFLFLPWNPKATRGLTARVRFRLPVAHAVGSSWCARVQCHMCPGEAVPAIYFWLIFNRQFLVSLDI